MNQMNAIVCNSFIFTLTSHGLDEGDCLQHLHLYHLYFDLRWNFYFYLRWRPRSRNLSCSQRTNLSGQLFLLFTFDTFDTWIGQISVIRKHFFFFENIHTTRPEGLNWNFLSLLCGLSNTWYVSPDLGSRRPSPGSHDPAGHQGVDHEDHDDGEEDDEEEAAVHQEVHHDDGEEEEVAGQPAPSPPLSPPGHRNEYQQKEDAATHLRHTAFLCNQAKAPLF